MIKITGSIFNSASWSHQPNTPKIALGITTNGIVKSNGLAVMGAGVAKAFAQCYPQLPSILGQKLIESGNQVHHLLSLSNIDIFSFPTKHHWRERSDLTLIITSAQTKPGCGLGGLSWSEVKNAISPILPDNCWIIDL